MSRSVCGIVAVSSEGDPLSASSTRGRSCVAVGLIGVLMITVVSCSNDSSDKSSPSTKGTSSRVRQTTSTSRSPATSRGAVVFGGDGNNLDAYEGAPPFRHQRVNAAFTPEAPQKPNPRGTDINAQICFFPDGSGRFIAGEDKNQTKGVRQGWGIFRLTGSSVGSFRILELRLRHPLRRAGGDNRYR